MTTPLHVANELLPIFRANALRGLTRTRGYYAYLVRRDVDTVGKALHLVGAACVWSCVPVAPIHFVDQVEPEWRHIFEIAAFGSIHAGAWNTLVEASRLHLYSESDFDQVASVFLNQLASHDAQKQTPYALWCALLDEALAPATCHYEQVISTRTRSIAPLTVTT